MSGPETHPNGQIVKHEPRPGDNLIALVNRGTAQIARALPRHINADRMARAVITAMRLNPDLYHSDEASFISAMLSLAQLGLEPNTPLQHAWLIPRKNNKRRNGGIETTVQLGYRGYIDLAMRSGHVSSIAATPVFHGDRFAWQRGTDPRIEHVPDEHDDRIDYQRVSHAYAVARLRGGDSIFEVLTRAQINERRLRSARPDAGPWLTDPIPMMLKTAIRALWRTLPMSADMAAAQLIDDAYDQQKPIASVVPDGPAADVLERMGMQGEKDVSAEEPPNLKQEISE
jgi:recombination protein RecT